jgi:hypothetical protein
MEQPFFKPGEEVRTDRSVMKQALAAWDGPRLGGLILHWRAQAMRSAERELCELLARPGMTRSQVLIEMLAHLKHLADWGITEDGRPRKGPEQPVTRVE